MKEKISKAFQELQDYITNKLEVLDGKSTFQEDSWERAEGGGGRTRVIAHGNVFEKGGVNFSAVHGPVSDAMKRQLDLDGSTFFATGVSIVLHPYNPFVPIMHMNVRYFEMDNGQYWFGGGIDMTPHYVDKTLAGDFHRSLKNVCDQYDPSYYSHFKKWADDYFFIPHRNETRGVGGIFYDRLVAPENSSKEVLLDFALDLGRLFPALYAHQYHANKAKEFDESNVQWRNLRRGRYVEFNLVHDKGTKFGLHTGGRIESILMSLPETASWLYDFKPNDELASKTLEMLKKDVDWKLL